MARIAGIDLPKNKRGVIGLTYIFGIGRQTAAYILDKAGISEDVKVQDWNDDQLAAIRTIINDELKVEGALRSEVQLNIKRLMDIGCYRGLRHRKHYLYVVNVLKTTPVPVKTISWSSAGKMGFRGSKKNTPYAASQAASDCGKVAHDLGLRKVEVFVKGPGAGRESAIRTLQTVGIDVTTIKDITPLPHNGVVLQNVEDQHGPSKRRGKQSEYAIQLLEKQKAKYTYGVLERQFSNLFVKAAAKQGITGIAPTRAAARQLVSHKHITVNGGVVNIPSYSLRPGDVIAVRERSQSLEAVTTSVEGRKINKFAWLEWNANEFKVINGQEQFLAGDITKFSNNFTVLNPDFVVCNMDSSVTIEVELSVAKGRGYVNAEDE
ncbi:hypothetical protein FQR65_LT17662 [Abscondita terminalis]|nr:hypothetical protein FQR65_LT17662 [Abscondita terminalis]